MALVIWLPLNGSLENKGTQYLTFTALGSSTLTNTGKVSTNCYGNSSYTDGGYVSTTTINLGQHQSVAAWVKFTGLTSDSSLGGSIAGQHRYPSNIGMGMTIKYVSSTTGYLSVNTGNGSARTYNTYCGSTLLQANTWYHLCYTYDGSTIRLYVNGTLDGTHSYSGMSTPADYFMVGCWSFSGSSGNSVYGGYKLNGYINDLRAYSHTLSTKEVKELAKGLCLHYKFNFEDLYKPVEYIQSSGTQYINTGVEINGNLETYLDFAFASYDSAERYIFGLDSPTVIGMISGSGRIYEFSGSVQYSWSLDTNRHTATVGKRVIFDGTTVSSSVSGSSTGKNAYLFCSNTGSNNPNYYSSTKLYKCKMWSGSTLVRDFIPCVRKTDGKPGLFDLVNNVFYTNSGSGEFTYSNPFAVLYTPVEYIDQVNPASQATSEHNRCTMTSVVYTKIKARVNVAGSGSSGGIMLSGDDGEWWKSWQGGGTGTVTMTPSSLSENTWTDVTWDMGTTYTGLKTSGWSDGTNYWTPQHMRIKYITTYNGSTITGHFVACIRNSDSKPGLYDTITNAFFTNTGSGSDFTYPSTTITNNKINDYSGCSRDGSLSNITSDNSTILGNTSSLFNGSNSTISIPNLYNVFTGGTNPFTVAFWIYNNDGNGSAQSNRAVYLGDYSLSGAINVNIEKTAAGLARFYWNGSPDLSFSAATIPASAWSHLAITYDGSNLKCYINGELKNTSSQTLSTKSKTSGVFQLGRDSRTGDTAFNGKMADFRIYTTALSANDIKELYQVKESIDNSGNLYCNNFSIDESIIKQSFEKSGIIKAKDLAEQITLSDGSTWQPICIHYVPNGVFTFSTSDYTKKFNYEASDRWTAFGVINSASRPESGYYEFLVRHQLEDKSSWEEYRWKQTVNPFTATWANVEPSTVGTNVIRISSTVTSSYGGMYWMRNTNTSSTNDYMTFANTSSGNWFCCGACANHNGGIPSYNGKVVKGWQLVYMRVINNNMRLVKNGLIIPTNLKEI